MNPYLDIPALDRPDFFDGELLDATDLEAVFDFARDVRWLHNRTLHAWGVAAGYTVTGAAGDRTVSVSPGYALDRGGHDLVLSRAVTVSVPAVAAAPTGGPMLFYLTASYATDADLSITEHRSGLCGTAGAVRRADAPRLRWQDPTDTSSPDTRYRPGLDVVLATAKVFNCQLTAAPSMIGRADARYIPHPFVACGATDATVTDWTVFPAAGPVQGLELIIDTSTSAFGATPVYTAQVLGLRIVTDPSSNVIAVLDGLVEVRQPSATGFTCRITCPRDLVVGTIPLNPGWLLDAGLPTLVATQLFWQVAWVGVER